MKTVSKFHCPSPSSLGGVRGKPPPGIKRFSFIDMYRQHTESEESHENNKKEQKIAAAKAYLQIHLITQYGVASSKGPSNLVTI